MSRAQGDSYRTHTNHELNAYRDRLDAKLEKLYEVPEMIRTPVVRNGKKATVGYCPEIWKDWE